MRRFSIITASLMLALPGTALCANGDLSEREFFEDLPVVLSASRLAQSPLDAPAPVTVIDRETIRDAGFTEIHELFRLVPGFLVADWPDGSPVVVNQGLGDAYSRRLLVLIDGRAVYDPFRGGVDWQDLPLRVDDIERIEVVRSPNPASYGANAFQGVINIFTRRPLGDDETEVVLRAGQRGIGEAYASASRGDGAFGWRLSASSREATNYRDRGVPLQENREGIRRQMLNAQLRWNPRGDEEWNLNFGFSDGRNLIGQSSSDANPVRANDSDSLFVQAGWKRFYAADSEVSLRYYHYGRGLQDRFRVFAADPSLAPVPALTVDLGYRVYRDDIEFQQIHAWSDALKLIWGTGLRRDQAESAGMLAGRGKEGGWQWQAFGTLDWGFARDWRMQLGGMLEKHYNTDRLFSPRLALNYRLSPAQSLRFSMGRGYRAPTIFETRAREMVTYAGGIADVLHYAYRDLEPESVRYIELGYIGQVQPLGLSLDARVFANRYRNYIDDQSCILDAESQDSHLGVQCGFPEPAGYERPLGYAGKPWYNSVLPFGSASRYGHYKAFYFFNAGELKVAGGDLSIDWSSRLLGRFRLTHARTRISASGVGADLTVNPAALTRDTDVELSAPRSSTSLLWSKRLPLGFNASLGIYRVGAMKWPNDGDWQPAYRRVDLRLGKTLGLFGNRDELSITVQNLDSEHTEFDDYLVEKRVFLTYRALW
jgi:iron complex outermembrane receptor protein